MWHVSSRSGVATLATAVCTLVTCYCKQDHFTGPKPKTALVLDQRWTWVHFSASNPTQPNPRMDPTYVNLCSRQPGVTKSVLVHTAHVDGSSSRTAFTLTARHQVVSKQCCIDLETRVHSGSFSQCLGVETSSPRSPFLCGVFLFRRF